MKNINLLIIGANGLLGTSMKKACKEKKINYFGLSHSELDILDKSRLEKKITEYNPEIIINASSMMGISACEEDPKMAFDINSLSVLNLAKICRERKIILVQPSSNTVFDGLKGELYLEVDIPNPQNVYGLSKYIGEKFVMNNLDSYYITRFPKLFGSRENNTLGFTDKMIDKMRKNEELKIAGNRVDTFTYSIHAARKILSLIQDKTSFGVYHIANQGSVSYYDFICKFAEKIGYYGKITKANDSDFPTLALNPLRVELGSIKIKDMPSWEKALDEYVETEKITL